MFLEFKTRYLDKEPRDRTWYMTDFWLDEMNRKRDILYKTSRSSISKFKSFKFNKDNFVHCAHGIIIRKILATILTSISSCESGSDNFIDTTPKFDELS